MLVEESIADKFDGAIYVVPNFTVFLPVFNCDFKSFTESMLCFLFVLNSNWMRDTSFDFVIMVLFAYSHIAIDSR